MRKIYVNGVIRAMKGARASAMSVRDGKFECVGGDSDVLNLKSPGDIVIDLAGLTVAPGFIDSHCHMLATGMIEERADLRGAMSHKEIISRAREHIKNHPVAPGEWIICRGYDDNLFGESALPTRDVANAISRDNPALIERVCGHIGTLNDLAIRELGITPQTSFTGGRADVDSDGRLTGVVRETALGYALERAPQPTGETLERVIARAAKIFNSHGVTCAHTDDLGTATWANLESAVNSLIDKGKLTLRIREELQSPNISALNEHIARGLKTGWGGDMFGVTGIKLLTDGSLGGRTAAMLSPYKDTGERGILYYEYGELLEIARVASENGLQAAFHAIGDAAARQCVNVALALGERTRRLRHRLVHAQFLNSALANDILSSGMCVDAQPEFAATDWRMIAPALGDMSRDYMYCWRRLLDMGINVAGGSDSPVEYPDALQAMRAAVTRRDKQNLPERGFAPEQAISANQALEMYTTRAAYNAFDEGRLGAIAPGMRADFVVLSDDPLNADLSEISVISTHVAGETVYQKR